MYIQYLHKQNEKFLYFGGVKVFIIYVVLTLLIALNIYFIYIFDIHFWEECITISKYNFLFFFIYWSFLTCSLYVLKLLFKVYIYFSFSYFLSIFFLFTA